MFVNQAAAGHVYRWYVAVRNLVTILDQALAPCIIGEAIVAPAFAQKLSKPHSIGIDSESR
jgi:hypothetical protein